MAPSGGRRKNYYPCPYCGVLTLESFRSEHFCTKRKGAAPYDSEAEEAALWHNYYRSQVTVVSVEELERHCKSFGEHSVVRSCCLRNIILAVGLCGTMVEHPGTPHQRFEPDRKRLYALMRDNLVYNSKMTWTGFYRYDLMVPLTPAILPEAAGEQDELRPLHDRTPTATDHQRAVLKVVKPRPLESAALAKRRRNGPLEPSIPKARFTAAEAAEASVTEPAAAAASSAAAAANGDWNGISASQMSDAEEFQNSQQQIAYSWHDEDDGTVDSAYNISVITFLCYCCFIFGLLIRSNIAYIISGVDCIQ